MPPSEPPDHRDHLRWLSDNLRIVLGSSEPTFESAVAFVSGYDAATGYSLLRDFQTWLVVQIGEGYEFHWRFLANCLALGVTPDSLRDADEDVRTQAGAALFALVLRHLDDFDDRDIRRSTYRAFEELRRRDGLP